MTAITMLLQTLYRSPIGVTAATLLYHHIAETYPRVGQALTAVIRFFKLSDPATAATAEPVTEISRECLAPPGLEEHLLTCVLGIVVIYCLFGPVAYWLWKKWAQEKSMIFARFIEELGNQNRAIGKAEGRAEERTKLLDQLVQEGKITPATRERLAAEREAATPGKRNPAEIAEEKQILDLIESSQHLSQEKRSRITALLTDQEKPEHPERVRRFLRGRPGRAPRPTT